MHVFSVGCAGVRDGKARENYDFFLEGAEELFKKGVEELGLKDGHGARERYLHEMVFCDGIVDVEVLKK